MNVVFYFKLTLTWTTDEEKRVAEVIRVSRHNTLGSVGSALVEAYNSTSIWATKGGPPVAKIEVVRDEKEGS